MRHLLKSSAAALLFIFFSTVLVFAQSSTGEVNGTVSDQNGAAIPGATVKLTNESTRIESELLTSQSSGRAIQDQQDPARRESIPTLFGPVPQYGSGLSAGANRAKDAIPIADRVHRFFRKPVGEHRHLEGISAERWSRGADSADRSRQTGSRNQLAYGSRYDPGEVKR